MYQELVTLRLMHSHAPKSGKCATPPNGKTCCETLMKLIFAVSVSPYFYFFSFDEVQVGP